ncbi:hypothetical protein FRC04_001258 [Tulasnella sp. 424]|nr:hypothetical protein FRC04_001258 [Tulasnella sp. 424]
MTAVAIPRRPTRGSRLQDAIPPRPANLQLSDIDSAFPLQEYITHLVQLDPHDVNTIVSIPEARKDDASGSGSSPEEKESGVDESCWIYEQLRRLAQDLTHPLITSLQAECNRTTCPEMKAGEWLYLCVAHGTGPSATMEQCCAIDYITHTLDSATALLNSPRAFPSRLQIPLASKRQFPSLARRLSRIFAHAYYHHREVFEQAEAESSLYARFLMLAKRFDLVPTEFLVLPGVAASETNASPAQPPPPTILQPPSAPQFQMPSMETGASHSSSQISSPPKAPEAQAHPGLAGLSLPMQRSAAAAELLAQLNREGTPPVRESSHFGGGGYANATIKSGGGHGMSDADRRALLNRSRTDTMYMKDFDLAEFAAAAGDAMSAVNAENAQVTAEDEGERLHDEASQGDDFVEVEMEDHPEPRGHEQEHPEDVDAEMLVEDLEEVVALEKDTGAEEPAPTPEVEDSTLPSQPAEPAEGEADAVEALGTALSQSTLEDPTPAKTEEPVPAVEPSEEAGVVETTGSEETDDKHVPLVPGEVKAVPAHLGLESEAGAEDGVPSEGPEWGEAMDVEQKET